MKQYLHIVIGKYSFVSRILFQALIVLLLLVNGRNGFAASFYADMIKEEDGKIETCKFYMLGDQYRMDVEEDGMEVSILVNRKSGKTRIVVHDEKVYLEVDNNHIRSLMSNPFEAYEIMLERFDSRSGGSEKIDGLECDKVIISSDGKDFGTAWVAKKYAFLIRLENNLSGMKVALKNIVAAPQQADLFQVPVGFRHVEKMPVAPPEWAGDIVDAPVMTPPFEQVLEQGQLIQVFPREGYDIKVEGSNSGDTAAAFTSVAFKDGRPLVDPSMKTINLSSSGKSGAWRNKEGPEEADYIVVRSRTGRITVKAEFIALPPKGVVVVENYTAKGGSGKGSSFDYRKAALLIISDNPDDGKPSQGALIIFRTIAKDMNGGTSFEKEKVQEEEFQLADGESSMWHFDEDRHIGSVHIRVLSGSVNVRIEQPEKAGAIPPSWKLR